MKAGAGRGGDIRSCRQKGDVEVRREGEQRWHKRSWVGGPDHLGKPWMRLRSCGHLSLVQFWHFNLFRQTQCYLKSSFQLSLFLPVQQLEHMFEQCAWKTSSHQPMTNFCMWPRVVSWIQRAFWNEEASLVSNNVTQLTCCHSRLTARPHRGLVSWRERKGKNVLEKSKFYRPMLHKLCIIQLWELM